MRTGVVRVDAWKEIEAIMRSKTSTVTSILGLVSAGRGITTVEHADYELVMVLFACRRFTTEVYGD